MTIPRTLLTRVRVEGFRSLKNVTLDLAPINVLIGPNGAGKSNLISVLRLVPLMRAQNLRYFVGREGGASTLLHYGPATTSEIELDLTFASDQGANAYHARLGYSAHDSLIFLDESVRYEPPDQEKPLSVSLGAGYGESLLMERARDPEAKTERVLDGLVERMGFFHFHDTSFTSPLRQNSVAADNRTLRSDGSNLATVMYRLRTTESPDLRPAWNRIEGLVKRVAPFIGRLEPDLVAPELPNSAIRLYWTDTSGHRFDEHDLSGGTLRAIALVVALAQPASTLARLHLHRRAGAWAASSSALAHRFPHPLRLIAQPDRALDAVLCAPRRVRARGGHCCRANEGREHVPAARPDRAR
jgi:predicted ATPase